MGHFKGTIEHSEYFFVLSLFYECKDLVDVDVSTSLGQ